MFILTAQRNAPDADPLAPWQRYRAYLAENRDRFPPSAYALATSEWYYNFNDHRCPHDGWLEKAVIGEPSSGKRNENRTVSIRLRLLGAYHDGCVELFYPRVYGYRMQLVHGDQGHRDWRYDEFRVTGEGRLLHEIEWWSFEDSGRWLIEASDVHHNWIPLADAAG